MKLRCILPLLGKVAFFSAAFGLGGQLMADQPGNDAPAFVHNLNGCFDVTYRFVEDGAHDYELKNVREWIDYDRDGKTHLLQHYYIVNNQAGKHWREEWSPNADGSWTQTVIGPFEDSRYSCTAKFHVNQWRCTAKNAPKPRRDENRHDYQTLDRDDTLQFTPLGWVQNENNIKRDKNGNEVAVELGWIEYRRTDNKNCQAAIELAGSDTGSN